MIRAVVFDLDGTLIDSAADLCAALNLLLREERLRPLSLAEVVPMIGDGAAKLVERAVAAADGEAGRRLPGLTRRFLALYEPSAVENTRAYPGVAEALETLVERGLVLGVCTNKPEQATRSILRALGLEQAFAAVLGGDSVPGARKPDPAVVIATLARLGARADEAVMIGDSGNDVAAARAAGLPVLLSAGGYTAVPAEALGADGVFHSFADLGTTLAALDNAQATAGAQQEATPGGLRQAR